MAARRDRDVPELRPGVRYFISLPLHRRPRATVIEPWSNRRLLELGDRGLTLDLGFTADEDAPRQIAYELPKVLPLANPGYDFAVGGAGMAHLAMAVLADLFGETERGRGTRAWVHHEAFAGAWLAKRERSFQLDGDELLSWVATHEEPCGDCKGVGQVASDDPADFMFGQLRQPCGACAGLGYQHRDPLPDPVPAKRARTRRRAASGQG